MPIYNGLAISTKITSASSMPFKLIYLVEVIGLVLFECKNKNSESIKTGAKALKRLTDLPA